MGAVDVPKDAPFIWDIESELYFRPESSGWLLCACDHTLVEPGEPPIDPTVVADLARKLAARFPALAGLPIAKVWAGLRTFAADGNFVVGPDPSVPGFHWLAGLGGHGVTCSAALGEITARSLLGNQRPEDAVFLPNRFANHRTSNSAPDC